MSPLLGLERLDFVDPEAGVEGAGEGAVGVFISDGLLLHAPDMDKRKGVERILESGGGKGVGEGLPIGFEAGGSLVIILRIGHAALVAFLVGGFIGGGGHGDGEAGVVGLHSEDNFVLAFGANGNQRQVGFFGNIGGYDGVR